MIDTAAIYGNEESVGEAIADSGERISIAENQLPMPRVFVIRYLSGFQLSNIRRRCLFDERQPQHILRLKKESLKAAAPWSMSSKKDSTWCARNRMATQVCRAPSSSSQQSFGILTMETCPNTVNNPFPLILNPPNVVPICNEGEVLLLGCWGGLVFGGRY